MFPGTSTPILRTIVQKEVLRFPVRTWANESSLRVEFFLYENHRQIGPLRLDEQTDRIQYWAAIARLCDSPASTIPFWPRSEQASFLI